MEDHVEIYFHLKSLLYYSTNTAKGSCQACVLNLKSSSQVNFFLSLIYTVKKPSGVVKWVPIVYRHMGNLVSLSSRILPPLGEWPSMSETNIQRHPLAPICGFQLTVQQTCPRQYPTFRANMFSFTQRNI